MPRATRMQSVKAMAETMGPPRPPLNPRSRPMQTAAAALLLLVRAAACAPSGPAVTVHTAGGDVTVAVEVARTPDEQQRGLMYRTALAEGHGMLFVFGDDSDRQFWMKNTLI